MFSLKLLSMLPVMCAKPSGMVDHTKVVSAIHGIHSRRSRLPHVVAPDGEYTAVSVNFSGEPTTLNVMETCYGYYVKPTERHYKYGFEDLFGLGAGCAGYNPNECVLIRK